MRKLIVLRGAPGSGKSTFVRQMDWEDYALSMDQLRLIRRAPELTSDGRFQISQEENSQVNGEFKSLIASRMSRGEFLIVDAQFVTEPKDILQLARDNNYKAICVDFGSMPIEQVIDQNEKRPELRRVNEKIIHKFYNVPLSEWSIPIVSWDKDNHFKKMVHSFVDEQIVDLSHYSKINHIGDLQGCLTVLTGPGGLLENGFNDDEAYIFVGDLLDRGIENGVLLKWFLDDVVPRSNTFLIWGNHEDHIWRWAKGQKAVSTEFETNTLPQLLRADLSPKDGLTVCKKAQELMLYSYNDQKVMVTHAGLPTVPRHPYLISSKQLSKGTGFWSDPIDEQFERNSPWDWVQVHGHRNHNWQEIQATPRSFNLENQVEFGGRLRWATLSASGWTTHSNKNTVFAQRENDMEQKIKWQNSGNTMSAETAATMRAHEGVKEAIQAKQPHVSSFNFKKDVFFSGSWDDVVVKARGFFVNNQTNEIVSRGYDKFFNINERDETKMDALVKNLQFPVVGFIKENGFLGNIGFDSQTNELFVATKSSSSGDFSDWFHEILNDQMSPTKQEGLARWLRDNEACMTFEVIDPVRDPHMVAYDKPKLVLLDIFHRSEHTERADYDTLKTVAKSFGFEVKGKGMVFRDALALEKWYEKVSQDITYRYHGQDIEGFVFEDTNGQMTKIKMANYAFWKRMRNQKDRMAREWVKILKAGDERNAKLDREPQNPAPRFTVESAKDMLVHKMMESGSKIHPAAELFLGWVATQPESEWGKSIIELRDQFMQTNPDPSIWSVPYSQDPEEQNAIMQKQTKKAFKL